MVAHGRRCVIFCAELETMLLRDNVFFSQPIPELCQRIQILNQKRTASGMPKILVHTDAAQMIGKGRVDVEDLGVDYLTVVGHKVYLPSFWMPFSLGHWSCPCI